MAVAVAFAALVAHAASQVPGAGDADSRRDLAIVRDEVRALKNANRSREALALVEDALSRVPEQGALVGHLLCHGAEALRQLRRYDESQAWLVRAARLAHGLHEGADQASLLRYIDVLSGLLDWSRGLPDLAFEAVERVRQRPPADYDEARDSCMLELLVLRALGYEPAAGRRIVETYEARYSRNQDLRIRAAAMVMDQQPTEPGDLATARQWLEQAAQDEALQPRERDIARIFNVSGSLNAGDVDRAGLQLEQLQQSLQRAGAEPPLNVPALALRHALDAHLDRELVQARHDQALAAWQAFLTTWARQNPSPRGLGPMAAADRQRLLAELMRARMWLAPEEAGVRAALQLLLDAEAHGTMARTVGARGADVETVVSALPPADGGIVTYVAGPDRTWVFTIDRDEVQAVELPVRSLLLERDARQLAEVLQTFQADPALGRRDVAAATERLAALLLPPPVCRRLHGWRSVVIVGLESLGYVPFELLRPAGARRLGETHATSYLPSLAMGVWLQQRRPATPTMSGPRAVLTACPEAQGDDASADSPVLAFGPPEQRALIAGAGAAAFEVLCGGHATLAASAARFPGACYWAVVAHGVRNDRRADPQGMRLGDGLVAWAADLEEVALPPFVFFGSCRAGRGRFRRGDDGRHLLHGAAMLAGARAVVAPWLDVDYRATLQLMAATHTAMFADGLPLAAALLQARRQVIGELGDDELTPFLFHVHGVGDAPACLPSRRGPPGLLIAAIALLAAAVAIVCMRRRRA